MKINSVSLRNFLLFDDETVQFGSFNILLGDNGSGKSSLGVSLELLRKWMLTNPEIDDHGRFTTVVPEPELSRELMQCIRRGADNPSWLSIVLRFAPRADADLMEITMTASSDATTGLIEIDGSLLTAGSNREPLGNPSQVSQARAAVKALRRVRINDYIVGSPTDDRNLFDPETDTFDRPPILQEIGYGVARFMAMLQYEASDRNTPNGRSAYVERTTLAEQIQALVPWASDFRTDSQGRSFALVDESGVEFPAARLSSGELRLVGLACMLSRTALAVRHREAFLFIEEPELGLSPRAIAALTAQFQSMPAQMVITTHSPWVPHKAVYGSTEGSTYLDNILVARRTEGRSRFEPASDLVSNFVDGVDLGRQTVLQGVEGEALQVWRSLMDSFNIR